MCITTYFQFEIGSGLTTYDCAQNTDFCHCNRVVFIYCDGNSLTGNQDKFVRRSGQQMSSSTVKGSGLLCYPRPPWHSTGGRLR